MLFDAVVQLLTNLAIAGDTKAGTLIGVDRFGNKFYENMEEELPRKQDNCDSAGGKC